MELAPNQPDLDLLKRFADGDEAAFAEIVRRYAGLVYSVCHRVLGERGWAEDVSQETFFRLLKHRQKVSQSLGGWLHRAATRLAVDALRSENARRRREAVVAAETYETVPGDEAGPTWADVSPLVDEALAELPDEERELLVRHFLQGVAQSNIAAERGVSTATLSRRVKDAVASLRLQLARKGVMVAPAVLLMLMSRNAAEAAPVKLVAGLGKMAMVSGGVPAGPVVPQPPAPSQWSLRNTSSAFRAKLALGAVVALAMYLAVPYLWLPLTQPNKEDTKDLARPSAEQSIRSAPPAASRPADTRLSR